MECALLLSPWRMGLPLASSVCTSLSRALWTGTKHLHSGVIPAAVHAAPEQGAHAAGPTGAASATALAKPSFAGLQRGPWLPSLAWPLAVRHWSTHATHTTPEALLKPSEQIQAQTAADVLSQIQMIKLREELDAEAEQHLHIPYTRFVDIAKACGASSDAEAGEWCQVLHKAGLLLRQNGVVYLRIEEVADMVAMMLPGGRADTEQKLAGVEAELAQLEAVHEEVERRSHRLADALLFAGFCVLVTQFFAFIYLTWWELSWDVMEPIAYIISLFYSIVAYLYFLTTREAFDLAPFKAFWAKRFKDKRIAVLQFDAQRYAYLHRLRDRYRRHLAHGHNH